MDGLNLSTNEWIVLGVVAFCTIVIPSWIKSVSNRRRYGYRAPQHGYSVSSVLMAMLPMMATLLTFFAVSAFLLGTFREQIPEKYHIGTVVLLGIADLGALLIALHVFLPAGYMAHLDNTPKGQHSPLDWLVGLLLTVVFFPAAFLQIGYFLEMVSA